MDQETARASPHNIMLMLSGSHAQLISLFFSLTQGGMEQKDKKKMGYKLASTMNKGGLIPPRVLSAIFFPPHQPARTCCQVSRSLAASSLRGDFFWGSWAGRISEIGHEHLILSLVHVFTVSHPSFLTSVLFSSILRGRCSRAVSMYRKAYSRVETPFLRTLSQSFRGRRDYFE